MPLRGTWYNMLFLAGLLLLILPHCTPVELQGLLAQLRGQLLGLFLCPGRNDCSLVSGPKAFCFSCMQHSGEKQEVQNGYQPNRWTARNMSENKRQTELLGGKIENPTLWE